MYKTFYMSYSLYDKYSTKVLGSHKLIFVPFLFRVLTQVLNRTYSAVVWTVEPARINTSLHLWETSTFNREFTKKTYLLSCNILLTPSSHSFWLPQAETTERHLLITLHASFTFIHLIKHTHRLRVQVAMLFFLICKF